MRYVWRRRLSRRGALAGGKGSGDRGGARRGLWVARGLCPCLSRCLWPDPRDIIRRGATDGLPLQTALETRPDEQTEPVPVIETMPERRIVGLRGAIRWRRGWRSPANGGEYNADGHALSDVVPDACTASAPNSAKTAVSTTSAVRRPPGRRSLPDGRRSRFPPVAGPGLQPRPYLGHAGDVGRDLSRMDGQGPACPARWAVNRILSGEL